MQFVQSVYFLEYILYAKQERRVSNLENNQAEHKILLHGNKFHLAGQKPAAWRTIWLHLRLNNTECFTTGSNYWITGYVPFL